MQSPPSNHLYQKRSGRLGSLIFLLILVAGLSTVLANRQNILDWYKLRSYQPPANISTLADQTSMTDHARRIFYINQPAIETKNNFVNSCKSAGREQTIVLGCYHSVDNGIFLLSVSDPRLDGVQQVTAAHEMLHGVYDRLTTGQRDDVNKMLLNYYQNELQDPRIKQTIDAYKKYEPNDLVNEMHSIFGTEIANLPVGLETYYKQYFNDRSKVTGFAAQYQAVFTSRQTTLLQYESQLAVLKPQIDQRETDLQSQQAEINDRRQQLDSNRQSGNITAYNAGVAGYNALIESYNANVEVLKGLIARYNQLVALHNAISTEQGQLINELSTSPQTIAN